MIPPQVERWVKETFRKPQIAEHWLSDCCDWVAGTHEVDPVADFETFIGHVEYQILSTSLFSSTVEHTGFPQGITGALNTRLQGVPPILIEVIAITEIGSSAFHLSNVRQTRMEREDLAGLAQQEGDEATAEEEGPIPNYPRQMLKFQVTDGTQIIPAIEYRRIPQLQLGETPLGLKILLKNVLVRRGILFLEPDGIEIKDPKFRTDEFDERRDFDFVNDLRRRMGKEELPYEGGDQEDHDELPPAPAQPQREVSEHPAEKIPSNSRQLSPSSTLVASRYFDNPENSIATLPTASRSTTVTQTNDVHMDQLSRLLSPVRGGIIDIDSSTETIDIQEQASSKGKGKARERSPQSVYDFDSDSFDWEEVERIEKEALLAATKTERTRLDKEIITIKDEDDEFDKEDKRPKKRVNSRIIDSGEEVIEISD